MKRSRFHIASLLILLTVFGCGDDPEPVSRIVGKWEVISSVPSISVPGGGNLVEYLMDHFGVFREDAEEAAADLESGEDFIDVDGTIEFKSNGTYTSVDGSRTLTGTWELSADEKKLMLDKGKNAETLADVTTLDDQNLVIKADVTENLEFPDEEFKYYAIITLKRI